jgi:hypothetical protein
MLRQVAARAAAARWGAPSLGVSPPRADEGRHERKSDHRPDSAAEAPIARAASVASGRKGGGDPGPRHLNRPGVQAKGAAAARAESFGVPTLRAPASRSIHCEEGK